MNKSDNYYLPSVFRRFLNSSSKEEVASEWERLAKRIGNVALPYVSLYKPIGTPIFFAKNGLRTFKHLSKTAATGSERNWTKLFHSLFKTASTIFFLVSVFFKFRIGLLISTVLKIAENAFEIFNSLTFNNSRRAAEKTFAITASSLQLGSMIFGGWGIHLACAIVQIGARNFQSENELRKGNYLEAAGNFGYGFVHLHKFLKSQ